MVSNVRIRFATEIIGYRVLEARRLTRQIIEGDPSKKYNLL